MAALKDMHSRYSHFEAWFYNWVIAPASLDVKMKFLSPFLDQLPSHASILDVGCGGGHVITEILKHRPDLTVFALDNSPEQIKRVRERFASIPDKVIIHEASAMDLPFQDQYFDFAYSIACIKHWPDGKKGLSEMLRVLKKGGNILITELDKDSDQERIQAFVNRWRIPNVLKKKAADIYAKKVFMNSMEASVAQALFIEAGIGEVEAQKIPDSAAFMAMGKKLK